MKLKPSITPSIPGEQMILQNLDTHTSSSLCCGIYMPGHIMRFSARRPSLRYKLLRRLATEVMRRTDQPGNSSNFGKTTKSRLYCAGRSTNQGCRQHIDTMQASRACLVQASRICKASNHSRFSATTRMLVGIRWTDRELVED